MHTKKDPLPREVICSHHTIYKRSYGMMDWLLPLSYLAKINHFE